MTRRVNRTKQTGSIIAFKPETTEMIDPGSRLDLSYPDCTIVETIANFRRRQIVVSAVRDLVREPLTPDEYLRRPLIRRSRWLVTGRDSECGQMRQFYAGSSREYGRDGLLRIALYEPSACKPYRILSRPFRETRRDRIILARLMVSHRNFNHDILSLRLIADDLRVIQSVG